MSEVDWSKPLDDPQHEKFARLVAGGMDKDDAYRAINPKVTKQSSQSLGPRLFGKVRNRIRWFQQQSAEDAVMDMKERRVFMRRVKRVDLARFDMEKDGDLIQEIDYHEDGSVKKIKTPGKRECVMADAELAGELVEKVDINIREQPTPEQIAEAVKFSRAMGMAGLS